ncbi:hypothetical protein FLW53_10040 [Microbispora sp. SCL1-1]|uniref:Uncharacterized protein n=1 Tax=Microbispora hainanensis TaxID=568844 RepID=A0ABZ1SY77_9ACTN|nr:MULTISPECIES: hypothetical protein [Microbispora]NJP24547.1 hypothetical protein [Microbispora sp. CL1-1]TQS14683.1 hypothetical protein FLW53_10040 [Microbispora sp. SCL1-1]
MCPEASVARWCARPIELGHPGLVLKPLVAGTNEVPVITDPGQAAEDIELAVLSAIHHAATPEGPEILNALFAALHNLDRDLGVCTLTWFVRRCLERSGITWRST